MQRQYRMDKLILVMEQMKIGNGMMKTNHQHGINEVILQILTW